MSNSPQSGIKGWINKRLPIFSVISHSTTEYPTPKNLSYLWNFGSLALFILVIMIVTGIFLAMNYTPSTLYAFDSVERIMRDVNYGWLIRYIHMNGASMFFIVVYIHIFRGLYYGSYKAPRELLWAIGLLILLVMMATAFLGYVLPWGQMSFWGATVITNLFSSVPWVGDALVTLLWGGFAVDNPTLNRFFSLHYLLPFIIFALAFLHLWALHTVKSNNPTGIEPKDDADTIPFAPYYVIKDYFGVGVFLIFFLFFVFYAPNFFGEPDNYIPANPLVTPPHIVPEWYLLPFYAILRSIDFSILGIDAKLLGVLAMFGSIGVLFAIPWLDTSSVRSSRYRPIYKWFFWLLLIDCFVLGVCGMKSPDDLFLGSFGPKVIVIGKLSTLYYFAHFLVVMPVVGWFEKPSSMPVSISKSILDKDQGASHG